MSTAVRWKTVVPRPDLRPGEVLVALEALHPPAADPAQGKSGLPRVQTATLAAAALSRPFGGIESSPQNA
jgi:hypothetical protein